MQHYYSQIINLSSDQNNDKGITKADLEVLAKRDIENVEDSFVEEVNREFFKAIDAIHFDDDRKYLVENPLK